MKKLILTLLFLFSIKLIACSSDPMDFCASSNSIQFQNCLIVSGKIIATDEFSIDLEIIDILKGSENKSIIKIWNGTDFDCNGIWSMKAADLGKLNDSIVVILPKIIEKENNWEVVGDYRRPDYFSYTTSLSIANGIVSGKIVEQKGLPDSYSVYSYDYTNFKTSWLKTNDCSEILSTNEIELNKIISVNTVVEDILKLEMNKRNSYELQILNLHGKMVKSIHFITREIELDLSEHSQGVYFLMLKANHNNIDTIKIIKM